jgi:hypothetical protein
MKINKKHIGLKVFKDNWTCCHMVVIDVGTKYVVGRVYDDVIDRYVTVEIYPINQDDWILHVDAKEIIKKIKVVNQGRKK